ncbi:MAG: hypothetical protein ACKPHU_05885, partial [Planctomycetaceae bacterium]
LLALFAGPTILRDRHIAGASNGFTDERSRFDFETKSAAGQSHQLYHLPAERLVAGLNMVHPGILWVEALSSRQMRLSIRVSKTPGRTIAFHDFW